MQASKATATSEAEAVEATVPTEETADPTMEAEAEGSSEVAEGMQGTGSSAVRTSMGREGSAMAQAEADGAEEAED